MEYKRKSGMEKTFAVQNRRMADIVRAAKPLADDAGRIPEELRSFEQRFSILLAPLIELAWSDGRVATHEMDAIFKVAEAYELAEDGEIFARLVESMISRATPAEVDEWWRRFDLLWLHLAPADRESVAFCLLFQARFIAERSSNDVVALIRGNRVGRDEREALQKIAAGIRHARLSAQRSKLDRFEASIKRTAAGQQPAEAAKKFAADDLDERLLPLVPLVKVAWAEGRITKRERQIVFEAAKRLGIRDGSEAFQRLSGWLEFQPTAEFYREALAQLSAGWTPLSEEEKTLRRLDVLSDCANIAEASGGTREFPAGGPRICPEEIDAVKTIGEKLSFKQSPPAAVI